MARLSERLSRTKRNRFQGPLGGATASSNLNQLANTCHTAPVGNATSSASAEHSVEGSNTPLDDQAVKSINKKLALAKAHKVPLASPSTRAASPSHQPAPVSAVSDTSDEEPTKNTSTNSDRSILDKRRKAIARARLTKQLSPTHSDRTSGFTEERMGEASNHHEAPSKQGYGTIQANDKCSTKTSLDTASAGKNDIEQPLKDSHQFRHYSPSRLLSLVHSGRVNAPSPRSPRREHTLAATTPDKHASGTHASSPSPSRVRAAASPSLSREKKQTQAPETSNRRLSNAVLQTYVASPVQSSKPTASPQTVKPEPSKPKYTPLPEQDLENERIPKIEVVLGDKNMQLQMQRRYGGAAQLSAQLAPPPLASAPTQQPRAPSPSLTQSHQRKIHVKSPSPAKPQVYHRHESPERIISTEQAEQNAEESRFPSPTGSIEMERGSDKASDGREPSQGVAAWNNENAKESRKTISVGRYKLKTVHALVNTTDYATSTQKDTQSASKISKVMNDQTVHQNGMDIVKEKQSHQISAALKSTSSSLLKPSSLTSMTSPACEQDSDPVRRLNDPAKVTGRSPSPTHSRRWYLERHVKAENLAVKEMHTREERSDEKNAKHSNASDSATLTENNAAGYLPLVESSEGPTAFAKRWGVRLRSVGSIEKSASSETEREVAAIRKIVETQIEPSNSWKSSHSRSGQSNCSNESNMIKENSSGSQDFPESMALEIIPLQENMSNSLFRASDTKRLDSHESLNSYSHPKHNLQNNGVRSEAIDHTAMCLIHKSQEKKARESPAVALDERQLDKIQTNFEPPVNGRNEPSREQALSPRQLYLRSKDLRDCSVLTSKPDQVTNQSKQQLPTRPDSTEFPSRRTSGLGRAPSPLNTQDKYGTPFRIDEGRNSRIRSKSMPRLSPKHSTPDHDRAPQSAVARMCAQVSPHNSPRISIFKEDNRAVIETPAKVSVSSMVGRFAMPTASSNAKRSPKRTSASKPFFGQINQASHQNSKLETRSESEATQVEMTDRYLIETPNTVSVAEMKGIFGRKESKPSCPAQKPWTKTHYIASETEAATVLSVTEEKEMSVSNTPAEPRYRRHTVSTAKAKSAASTNTPSSTRKPADTGSSWKRKLATQSATEESQIPPWVLRYKGDEQVVESASFTKEVGPVTKAVSVERPEIQASLSFPASSTTLPLNTSTKASSESFMQKLSKMNEYRKTSSHSTLGRTTAQEIHEKSFEIIEASPFDSLTTSFGHPDSPMEPISPRTLAKERPWIDDVEALSPRSRKLRERMRDGQQSRVLDTKLGVEESKPSNLTSRLALIREKLREHEETNFSFEEEKKCEESMPRLRSPNSLVRLAGDSIHAFDFEIAKKLEKPIGFSGEDEDSTQSTDMIPKHDKLPSQLALGVSRDNVKDGFQSQPKAMMADSSRKHGVVFGDPETFSSVPVSERAKAIASWQGGLGVKPSKSEPGLSRSDSDGQPLIEIVGTSSTDLPRVNFSQKEGWNPIEHKIDDAVSTRPTLGVSDQRDSTPRRRNQFCAPQARSNADDGATEEVAAWRDQDSALPEAPHAFDSSFISDITGNPDQSYTQSKMPEGHAFDDAFFPPEIQNPFFQETAAPRKEAENYAFDPFWDSGINDDGLDSSFGANSSFFAQVKLLRPNCSSPAGTTFSVPSFDPTSPKFRHSAAGNQAPSSASETANRDDILWSYDALSNASDGSQLSRGVEI